MYEVVVTYRVDFTEQSVERFQTSDEAQEAARRIMFLNYDRIVRARVRAVKPINTV